MHSSENSDIESQVIDSSKSFPDKIDSDRYFGRFRGYTRTNYHAGELRASWVELFTDLIFVAIIVHMAYEFVNSLPKSDDYHYTYSTGTAYNATTANTSTSVYTSHRRMASASTSSNAHCGEYDYLWVVFAQFGLFTSLWTEQIMYHSHFIFNQLHDEFLRVTYLTCSLAMGIFIGNDHSYHVAFLTCYAVLRFFSLFMYFKAMLIPRAKVHALWHIILYLVILVSIFWLIFAMNTGYLQSDCPLLYFAIYSLLFVVEWIGRTARLLLIGKKDNVHNNVPHIAERYGLFVMIILGESLISLMTADIGSLDVNIGSISMQDFYFVNNKKNTQSDVMQVLLLLLVFVNSYLIGRLYYCAQPSEHEIVHHIDHHALGRKNKIYSKMYSAVHQVLFFGLFGYGVGVKLVTKHLLLEERVLIDVLLPGYSLFAIVISLNIIRLLHPFEGERPKWVWIQRIFIIVVMGLTPLAAFQSINQGIIFTVLFVCVLMLVVVDIEGHHQLSASKQIVENTRRKPSRMPSKIMTIPPMRALYK